MPAVFFNYATSDARLPRMDILFLLEGAQKVFKNKIGNKTVSVLFVSPEFSKKLNSKYRSKKKPTNVLSFPSQEKGELGDIFICPAIAKKEASDEKIGFKRWVGYLFLHGLLHLLGYEHKTEREARRMDLLIKKIICD